MAHIRSRKHTHSSHLLALVAAALPAATMAQESETSLPAMTVKAVADVPFKAEKSANAKFTQALVDTPQTVQVIKKEVLQEQGAATLMEALRNTPGITMQLGENGNTAAGDTFSMRGFSTQSATFVDGVRDLGAVTRDVFNLEQVEVVKGPAGADIGRGSQAGYINLISKLPQAADINYASLAVGSDNYNRLSADLNKQIADGVAVRLNVMGQDSDVAGRNVVNNKSIGIAPSIAFGLDSPTRVYLYSQHIRQDNVPDGGIPSIGLDGFYNADAALLRGAKVDRKNFYGSRNDYEKVEADMLTARIEHDFGDGSRLTNLTRYGRTTMDRRITAFGTAYNRNGSLDPALWTVALSRQGTDQENEIIANQTNLSTEFATGPIRHSLSAGLEFMYESQRSEGFCTNKALGNSRNSCLVTQSFTAPNASLYAPNAGVSWPALQKTGAFTDGNTSTAALYAFDTLKFSERWMLNGGVRFEHYKTQTDSAAVSTAGVLVRNDRQSAADDLFSWKLGAVYKPAANGSIYAAYARSYTPPGSAAFALSATATSADNAAMDPQQTDNAEIGTKWELLEKRLNLSAALYRTENDKQTSYDVITLLPVQYGKTRVEGVELSAVGQLTNNWQITAGIATMKTKQLDQYTSAGVENSKLRWSPDLTATLWTSYSSGAYTLGGGTRYVSEQKRIVASNVALTDSVPNIPAYWVTDLMGAYRLNKNLNLRLNVYNLFDKDYISTLNNSGFRVTMGAPRSAVLSANFTF